MGCRYLCSIYCFLVLRSVGVISLIFIVFWGSFDGYFKIFRKLRSGGV